MRIGYAIFGCVAMAVLATTESASAGNLNASKVMDSARSYLSGQNRQLVEEGALTFALSGVEATPGFTARATADAVTLSERRVTLAALGEEYSGFDTEVRVIDVETSSTSAVATIEELTTLRYASIRGDEPPYTAFKVQRRFVYSKVGSRWLLDSTSFVDASSMLPVSAVFSEPASGSRSPTEPTSAAPLSPDALELGSLVHESKEIDAGINYNYPAMAAYATTWALGRNPAYRSFASDCTNFISQSVYAGNWPMVSGWYQSNDVWWYNSLNQSYTWAGAENWYWFATGSGRTYILSNVWNMGLADVLQMDFTGNGSIDHSMIVTTTSASERYLSYHSTDTLNRSLTSIINANPSSWYYAHRT